MRARLASLCAVLLLTACATPPPVRETTAEATATQARRALEVGAWQRWGLTARLGLDDGESGGSGRLDWRVEEARSTLDFRGTLGRGAWRMTIDDAGVVLQRGDGTTTTAGSVAELVATETGLVLPVDALQWWVRGLADPAVGYEWQFQSDGLPEVLHQSGWQVHYRSWMEHGAFPMPRRLEATDGRQRVSLAVGKWWHGGDGPDA